MFLMPIYLIAICFRGFDDEMRAVVARNLEGRGINLHPRTNLTEVLSPLLGFGVNVTCVAFSCYFFICLSPVYVLIFPCYL